MAAKVTVKPVVIKAKGASTLAFGKSAQPSDLFRVAPAGKKLNYVSSDENVVTVTTDGAIKAVGMGTATITASSKYAAKSASVKVSVLSEEGITAVLTNPIAGEYENTVLVSNPGIVNVQVVKNGKAFANETVVFTITGGTGDWADYVVQSGTSGSRVAIATTNAYGVASFAVKHVGTIESNDTTAVASIKYTVTAGTTGDKLEASQQIDFAAVYISDLKNINGDPTYKEYAGLVPSRNDNGNGKTTTETAATKTTNTSVLHGNSVDYVDSQQTSTIGNDEHKVGFVGAVPMIKYPDNASDLSKAERFEDTSVAYTSDSYHTYASDTHSFELKYDPKELTYATLNFSKVQLSAYTKMEIAAYKDGGKTLIPNSQKSIVGEAEQNDFSYQIPLHENYSGIVVKVTLKSAGQVNLDKNSGYSVKSISGVYKTQTVGGGALVRLDGAEITWEQSGRVMSQPETLFTKNADGTPVYENSELLGAFGTASAFVTAITADSQDNLLSDDKIKKVTYQVPVFPYTGVAVFTCYDATGAVVAMYAYPTVNAAKDDNLIGVNGKKLNINVLDYAATDSFYRITNEEANRSVNATVEYKNDILTVNSTQTGYASLKGSLTYNGKYTNLDATNDTVYTSVQWSPLPTASEVNSGFLALIGQEIPVTDQLIDKNGDAVSQAGVSITFSSKSATLSTTDATLPNADVVQNSRTGAKVSIVSVNPTTDANGQAKLVLKSSDIATALSISAKANSSLYDVKLVFGSDEAKIADLYWVDADLQFVGDINNVSTTTIGTSIATPIVSTSGTSIKIEPKTGSKWEYGVKTVATTGYGVDLCELEGGVLDGKRVTDIAGLKAVMSKGAGSVTSTVTLKENNNAEVTSTKAGPVNIISALNASSVADEVVFTVSGAKKTSVANKTSKTSLSKKLTLVSNWKANGLQASIFTADGTYVATSSAAINATVNDATKLNTTTVYVRVSDENGNALQNKVTFKVESAFVSTSAAIGFGTVNSDGTITPNTDGIAALNVTYTGSTAANTIVSATVDGITSQAYSTTIHWVDGADFSLDTDVSVENDNIYSSRIDANGNIVLAFTDAIVSEVFADLFKVTITEFGDITGKKYDVSVVAYDEKTITLKVLNGPSQIPTKTTFAVTYKSATVDGILHQLTSEQGVVMKDNATFTVVKGATPNNVSEGYAAPSNSVVP